MTILESAENTKLEASFKSYESPRQPAASLLQPFIHSALPAMALLSTILGAAVTGNAFIINPSERTHPKSPAEPRLLTVPPTEFTRNREL